MIFSAILIAVMALSFRYLPQYGKSNVDGLDGLLQHFPALYFFNDWIRSILRHPLAPVSHWSWRMGLGADVIGTLAHYVIGDPFALVSLLFSRANLQAAYEVGFFLRVFAAGIASWLYLQELDTTPLGRTFGCLIYGLSSYTFLLALRHPFFENSVVYLPLLLLGVERALRRSRVGLLVVSAFVAAVSNFYFFYMLTLITIIYAFVRYMELTPSGKRWSGLAAAIGRLSAAYLAGACLAAPVLFPAIGAFFASSRVRVPQEIHLFYTAGDYVRILQAFVTPLVGPHWTYGGYAAVTFVTLPALYARRGNAGIKVLIALFAGFMLLPAAGSVFNGMSFPSNRFGFALALMLATGTALVVSGRSGFSRQELVRMVAGYGGLTALVALTSSEQWQYVAIPIGTGLLTLIAFAFASLDRKDDESRPAGWSASPATWIALALVVFSIGWNATLLYDHSFKDSLAGYVPTDGAIGLYQEHAKVAVSKIPEEPFSRIDKQDYVPGRSNAIIPANDPLVQGYNGTAVAFSIMNGNLGEFLREMNTRTIWLVIGYFGFDDRATLESLLGVKYYVGAPGLQGFIPYGFAKYRQVGESGIYKNENVLPLGFVYHSAVARSDYDALNSIDKQQAMLRGVVIDGEIPDYMERVTARRVARLLPHTLSASGCSIDETSGLVIVASPKASITMQIAPVKNSELYAEISQFDYLAMTSELSESATALDKFRRWVNGTSPQPSAIPMRWRIGRLAKAETWYTPENPYFWGNRTHLVNLGYQRSSPSTVALELSTQGTLSFKALRLYALPMDSFAEDIRSLAREPLRDISIGTDSVRGTVTCRRPGLLFLSIPYSNGWTARVDGEPAQISRCNTGFLGVAVPAGEHKIELSYRTPLGGIGLMTGALALLGLLLFFGRRQLLAWSDRDGRRSRHAAR